MTLPPDFEGGDPRFSLRFITVLKGSGARRAGVSVAMCRGRVAVCLGACRHLPGYPGTTCRGQEHAVGVAPAGSALDRDDPRGLQSPERVSHATHAQPRHRCDRGHARVGAGAVVVRVIGNNDQDQQVRMSRDGCVTERPRQGSDAHAASQSVSAALSAAAASNSRSAPERAATGHAARAADGTRWLSAQRSSASAPRATSCWSSGGSEFDGVSFAAAMLTARRTYAGPLRIATRTCRGRRGYGGQEVLNISPRASTATRRKVKLPHELGNAPGRDVELVGDRHLRQIRGPQLDQPFPELSRPLRAPRGCLRTAARVAPDLATRLGAGGRNESASSCPPARPLPSASATPD